MFNSYTEKDEEPMDTNAPKPVQLVSGFNQSQSPDVDKAVLSPNPDSNIHSFPNEYDQTSN